ncbi:MAG: ferrous iron transport protein B [Bryobacterales bacterium]|nr:ferrous iron transport protein B [Bryobacterales bacterium]
MDDCHGAPTATLPQPPAAGKQHIVAIVGPPNSGKSTLFNRLTGLRQKVANFPGVTVEHRMGRARLDHHREIYLVDLPGVYSLHPRTEDEKVTHDVLAGTMEGLPKPDAVILILDSTNLSRHLSLAAPILGLGLPTLVVLNMADDLHGRGGEVDPAELSKQLGTPVALISASRGSGIEKITEFLSGATLQQLPRPPLVELPVLQNVPKIRDWAANIGRRTKYRAPAPPVWTRRLDGVFLHPVTGLVVFLLVIIGVFQTIFAGARPLMDAVQAAIEASGRWIEATMPDSPLRSLIVDGIWSGVGSVIVFLPQILLLFLFIGILEDSGYLARAALIADRTMAKIGLQGKSFIPLLSAYACAVPAIMAARTIENKRDRTATILIAPFMTCSARLPVYTLVIAAFIPEKPLLGIFFGTRAAALLGLYVIGFLAAIVTARLLKSTVLKSTRAPFVLEMPPYRWPTVQSLALRLIDRSRVFLRRAGTVILAVSVVLWVLSNLPLENGKAPEIGNSYAGMVGHAVEPVIQPLGFNWKIGIGLITSLAAREVIVGTLGTLYGIEGTSESMNLQSALRHELTPGGAAALLVFFAFAMQCMSTLAVVRRETGGWTWPVIQFVYMTLFAYVFSFAANRLISLWF